MRKEIKNNKAGVSAVIGVILMVAIIIVIAATVYVYVSTNLDIEDPYEVVRESVEMVSGYEIEHILFKYVWNVDYMQRVEITIVDYENASVETVKGFIYNNKNHKLGYDGNSDLIWLKEVET